MSNARLQPLAERIVASIRRQVDHNGWEEPYVTAAVVEELQADEIARLGAGGDLARHLGELFAQCDANGLPPMVNLADMSSPWGRSWIKAWRAAKALLDQGAPPDERERLHLIIGRLTGHVRYAIRYGGFPYGQKTVAQTLEAAETVIGTVSEEAV